MATLEAADHPHAGGENLGTITPTAATNGPSPRGWGKLLLTLTAWAADRTIPTRVGKTGSLSRPIPAAPDHPHAGGENWLHPDRISGRNGPSPRGWGKRQRRRHPTICQRTIPTRVGKTRRLVACVPVNSDHPHAGGENVVPASGGGTVNGPSPRGWGKRDQRDNPGEAHRTIPTRVGKTTKAAAGARFKTDHPHAGGENTASRPALNSSTGPSPRGWGKRKPVCVAKLVPRTIPTRVGKT